VLKRVEISVGVAMHMTSKDCKQLSKIIVHTKSTHISRDNLNNKAEEKKRILVCVVN
jgi:hypothetical protein